MKEYLKNDTKVREDILNQKLFFELKEASARQKVHLKIYLSDVDIDGFDVIIDNNDDQLAKFQLKSRLDATTSYFDIHSVMLRPNWYVFDSFEFLSPMGCASNNRGVILIDANVVDNKIISRYSYLDVFILRALELGIFQITSQSIKKAGEHLRVLRNDNIRSNEKIEVLDSLFFPLKDAEALLEIMNFNTAHNSNLAFNILELSKIVAGTSIKRYSNNSDKISDMRVRWGYIQDELRKLENPLKPLKYLPLKADYFDLPPLSI